MKNVIESIKETRGLSLIIVAVFLLLAFLILFLSLSFKKPSEPIKNVTPTETPQTYSNIKPGSLETMVERLSERKPLSKKDTEAKQYILKLLNNNSGIINQASNYKMEYVRTIDDIEIEILTENIDAAKKESLLWLSRIPNSGGLGFSKDGICSFPVVFYLNFDVKISLPESAEFDPNPDGCN